MAFAVLYLMAGPSMLPVGFFHALSSAWAGVAAQQPLADKTLALHAIGQMAGQWRERQASRRALVSRTQHGAPSSMAHLFKFRSRTGHGVLAMASPAP